LVKNVEASLLKFFEMLFKFVTNHWEYAKMRL